MPPLQGLNLQPHSKPMALPWADVASAFSAHHSTRLPSFPLFSANSATPREKSPSTLRNARVPLSLPTRVPQRPPVRRRKRLLSANQKSAFDRTLRVWLLIGALGLRATRGGGSFQWNMAPRELGDFRISLSQLLQDARLSWDVLEPAMPSAEAARKVITDTISHKAFSSLRFPLGAVRQGPADDSGAPSRKTSPLRFTVRKFSDGYRIIASWDARSEVTGNRPEHLQEAIRLLANGSSHSSSSKEIGRMLQRSSLAE